MTINFVNWLVEGKLKKREEIYAGKLHKTKTTFRTPDKIQEIKAEDENTEEMKEILREIQGVW